MSTENSRFQRVTLLAVGVIAFLSLALLQGPEPSFVESTEAKSAGPKKKTNAARQGRRSARDDRETPANNYGFTDPAPFGTWAAQSDLDHEQVNDPNVPVVIAGLRSYVGKGNWRKHLMIKSVLLKNNTADAVKAVKLGWIILTEEDRYARKNVEAALVRGYTPLLDVEGGEGSFNSLKAYIDFVKEAKPLIKAGLLNGRFFIRVRVSEVQFQDGFTWREGEPLAYSKRLFSHARPLTAEPQSQCPKEICFFEEDGQGYCVSDPLGNTACVRENCSPDDPDACFCNVYVCGVTCFDNDGDDFWSCVDDCNDSNANVNPGATENCNDTVDNNCDLAIDCGDLSCSTDPNCDIGPDGCTTNQRNACTSINQLCSNGLCYTPILIDTLGDGLKLTNAQQGVRFDLGGGVAAQIAWTQSNSDDAWLALDRNGNGSIDSGAELFGNVTAQPSSSEPNGFLALAVFDKPANGGNGDEQIDSRDAVFSNLRLWTDKNHNGVSEANELFPLQSLNVQRISLEYKLSKLADEHGNQWRYRAKVRNARGSDVGRWAWDVVLKIAP